MVRPEFAGTTHLPTRTVGIRLSSPISRTRPAGDFTVADTKPSILVPSISLQQYIFGLRLRTYFNVSHGRGVHSAYSLRKGQATIGLMPAAPGVFFFFFFFFFIFLKKKK